MEVRVLNLDHTNYTPLKYTHTTNSFIGLILNFVKFFEAQKSLHFWSKVPQITSKRDSSWNNTCKQMLSLSSSSSLVSFGGIAKKPFSASISLKCQYTPLRTTINSPDSMASPKWAQKTVTLPPQRRGCHLVTSKVCLWELSFMGSVFMVLDEFCGHPLYLMSINWFIFEKNNWG